MKKRILSLLLCTVMIFSLLPAVFASDGDNDPELNKAYHATVLAASENLSTGENAFDGDRDTCWSFSGETGWIVFKIPVPAAPNGMVPRRKENKTPIDLTLQVFKDEEALPDHPSEELWKAEENWTHPFTDGENHYFDMCSGVYYEEKHQIYRLDITNRDAVNHPDIQICEFVLYNDIIYLPAVSAEIELPVEGEPAPKSVPAAVPDGANYTATLEKWEDLSAEGQPEA